jgi:hypothetical protein
MPLLLRTVRENRWLKSEAAPWLERGEVPADPLGDMRTIQNCLSVCEVKGDRSNLERIVTAVVLGLDRIADQGYVLFDSSLLSTAGITHQVQQGQTPDEAANEWHRDLTGLSGSQLVMLAKLILETGESGTVLKKRLRQLVEDGIERRELPERVRSKLAK